MYLTTFERGTASNLVALKHFSSTVWNQWTAMLWFPVPKWSSTCLVWREIRSASLTGSSCPRGESVLCGIGWILSCVVWLSPKPVETPPAFTFINPWLRWSIHSPSAWTGSFIWPTCRSSAEWRLLYLQDLLSKIFGWIREKRHSIPDVSIWQIGGLLNSCFKTIYRYIHYGCYSFTYSHTLLKGLDLNTPISPPSQCLLLLHPSWNCISPLI